MAEAQHNYLVLARKYRPTKFSEVIGQDVLVRTLSNSLKTGRLAHAFILTGVRGVGKTTTARLIARALNCIGEDGKSGPTTEPCGQCEQCIAISQEKHVDVIEVDAASRTGVDDVRELIDGVHYKPSFGRYKVYIIDEVHMLSKSAFNALLKTLEEPPAQVKFVFATTEIRKVPVTILSRCQRFDLRRVDVSVMQEYFAKILEKEKVSFEETALALLCKAADGSVRDGQSLLDQAINGSDGKITEDSVKDMLGLNDKSEVIALIEAILRGDIEIALKGVRQLLYKGAEPLKIIQDLMEMLHAFTALKLTPESVENLMIPTAEIKRCQKIATNLLIPDISMVWQVFVKGQQELKQTILGSQTLEMIIIRALHVKAVLASAAGGGNQTKSVVQEIGLAKPTTTAQEAVAVTPIDISCLPDNYADVVKLFSEKKEPILASHLEYDVRVTKYNPGKIQMHIPKSVPATLGKMVREKLTAWTAYNWEIIADNDEFAPTLSEQRQNQQQELMDRLKKNPEIQKILEVFPDSKINTIQ
jgi:DNA polymerase-3 subunit gamma/tau